MAAQPTITNRQRRQAFLDPVKFQQVALQRRLWNTQKRILRAIDTRSNIAVKGCHASGKTFTAAGAVPWWLTKHKTGKVITIAPTLRQVKLMWGEISLALKQSRIAYPEPSSVGLKLADDRYAIGISSSRGVNIQGFHGSDILVIADEAPGIEADIWEAVEGIRAGGKVTVLELGNPTVPSGHFYENFTRGRNHCECVTISAFDSPNLEGVTVEQLLTMTEDQLDWSPWPLLTQRRWVKDRYERWGPTNPRYVSRVLGEFPSQSEHSVFDVSWIERAKREPTPEELLRAQGNYVQVGIDVAGPGDAETAAVARVNGIKIARQAWPDKDPRGAVLRWISALKATCGYEVRYVVVDIAGIGYGFALHLADNGMPVIGFNAGYRAVDPEKYTNAKAESYFRLRDMYRDNYISHMPGTLDEECEAQLSAIEYRETSRGLVQIEPKDEARKRGVMSPDRAEAEMMAYCAITPREQRVEFGQWQEISPI